MGYLEPSHGSDQTDLLRELISIIRELAASSPYASQRLLDRIDALPKIGK